MRKKLTAALAALAFLFLAPVARAGDSDLLREKVREGMIFTFNAVAAEDAGTANHAQRVAIVRGWFLSPEEWAPRGVRFVLSQQPTYADQCDGDAEAIRVLDCAPGAGTQSDVNFLMSSWLTNLVGAGIGG